MNELIVSDPRFMMGKPTVAGTRITVEHILEEMGGGQTIEDLLDAHPQLTRESILAALTFSAQAINPGMVYPRAAQSA